MPISDGLFVKILELAWPAYQKNVDEFMEEFESGERCKIFLEHIHLDSGVRIPFMCWHIDQLRRDNKISKTSTVRTKFKIMHYFLGTEHTTIAGMLVNKYNLKQDTASKVKGARLYWLHVIGLYKMYDAFPPNPVIVNNMKESHPELFESS